MILREIFVKLGLDLDKSSFEVGRRLTEKFVDTVVDGIKELAKLPMEAAHAFVELVEQTAEAGHELELMHQKTGILTEDVQKLRRAAELTGVGADTLNTGIRFLSKSMAAASAGTGKQADAFRKLGVGVKGADGHLKSGKEILEELSEKFKEMPPSMEKAALAQAIFSRSGANMIPLLNKGKEGLEELTEGMFVYTDGQTHASEEIVEAQKSIAFSTQDMWRGAIAPLLPQIAKLVKAFARWRKESAEIWKGRLEKVFHLIVDGVEVLANAFKFLEKNSYSLKVALGIATLAFVALNLASVGAAIATAAAWAVVAAPFVAIGAGIYELMLIVDDLRMSLAPGGENKKTVFNDIKKWLDEFTKPHTGDVWFVAAIRTFLRLIKEAMGSLDDFKKEIGGSWWENTPLGFAFKKLSQKMKSNESGRAVEAAGVELMRFAPMESTAPRPEPLTSFAPPKPTPPLASFRSPMSYAPARSNVNNITINATPGMSEERLAQLVSEEIQAHEEKQNEQAMSSKAGQ